MYIQNRSIPTKMLPYSKQLHDFVLTCRLFIEVNLYFFHGVQTISVIWSFYGNGLYQNHSPIKVLPVYKTCFFLAICSEQPNNVNTITRWFLGIVCARMNPTWIRSNLLRRGSCWERIPDPTVKSVIDIIGHFIRILRFFLTSKKELFLRLL